MFSRYRFLSFALASIKIEVFRVDFLGRGGVFGFVIGGGYCRL